jgi:hypothetical protein
MKSLILYLSLLSTTSLLAYPIDPRPLRMLVKESQYIIVGYVQKVVPIKTIDNHRENSKAIIEIREVLQGKVDKKIIEVPYIPNMICPAPPVYMDSTMVLAFLDNKKGVYHTVALSYGAKTLESEEAIQVYKTRIQEIQSILEVKDEREQYNQTIEWLVKCAENPITRWEGTYELSPESDFMSFYKRSEAEKFGLDLDKNQKQRLKKALFKKEKEATDYVDFGLVDLIYNDYTEEIDKLLIDNLKNIDEKALWYADAYMNRLSHRTNDPRALRINIEYRQLCWAESYNKEPKRIEKLKGLITEFVAIVE